jgi:hypothetical protein
LASVDGRASVVGFFLVLTIQIALMARGPKTAT